MCVRSVINTVRITRFISVLSDRMKGSPTSHLFFRLQVDPPFHATGGFPLVKAKRFQSLFWFSRSHSCLVPRPSDAGTLHAPSVSLPLNARSIGPSFSRPRVDWFFARNHAFPSRQPTLATPKNDGPTVTTACANGHSRCLDDHPRFPSKRCHCPPPSDGSTTFLCPRPSTFPFPGPH